MKSVTTKAEFKTHPHFAAIEFGSIYIEGDERSRTAPGHGYPAHYESTVTYTAFENKEEMEEWVRQKEDRKYSSSESYMLIEAKPLKVETKITVVVS